MLLNGSADGKSYFPGDTGTNKLSAFAARSLVLDQFSRVMEKYNISQKNNFKPIMLYFTVLIGISILVGAVCKTEYSAPEYLTISKPIPITGKDFLRNHVKDKFCEQERILVTRKCFTVSQSSQYFAKRSTLFIEHLIEIKNYKNSFKKLSPNLLTSLHAKNVLQLI